LRTLREAVARNVTDAVARYELHHQSVDGEPDNVGRTTLTDEKRKALIAAAVVFFCFPFVWPAEFWVNMLASAAAGVLVYVTTYLILRRRRSG
jgi:hypothetical protein